MKTTKQHKKAPNQSKKTKHEYQVCEIESANCIIKYGMYVSQPWKYAGTHILLHCGMILHYYATFGYLHPALGIINIVLHILSTIVLVILAFTDPGMIPKILPSYEKLPYRKIPTNYHHYSTLLKYYQKNYRVVVKGHNLQLKFCNTCYIYRPPRAVHCQDCGTCIQKFDHHCPWIGTCVAKRNYKYFLTFLSVLSLLTTMMFVQTIVVTAEHTKWEGSEIIAKSVINIFLCIYIFPAMGFALFMLVLHLKFAATNVTTNEFCKQTWQNLQGNPFKKSSWIKNVLKILSLHYQGKVRFQEPVYNRNDRIMVQNESITSLNESKDVNKTFENLNYINESKYKSHNQYSTTVPQKSKQQEDEYKREETQKPPKNLQKQQKHQSEQQTQKPKQNSQILPEVENPDPTSISIYDINLRFHTHEKDQSSYSGKQLNQVSINSQGMKTNSLSLQSQKDPSEYEQEEMERQEDHKLKVITEENESQIEHTIDANIEQKSMHSPLKSLNKDNSVQMSIMKMQESQDESILRENQHQEHINNEKYQTNDRTISIGNFRKRKKSGTNEPRFL